MIILKKITKIGISLLLIGISFLTSIYVIAFLSGKPAIGKSSYIEMVDDRGNIFYQANHENSGTYVDLEEVSPHFIDSIIAIEDQDFYKHHGFDFVAIMRALLNNIMTDSTQGASTITQQYARNLFLSQEVTLKRKIEEAFYTMKIETHYSKDEILEGYINTIYFGHGIYGIENAAMYYFNKSSKDLTLSEASMLAGIINGPNIYSPIINYENSKKRQQLVLEALRKQNKIDDSTFKHLLNEPFDLTNTPPSDTNQTLMYFKDTVIEELKDLGFYTNEYLNKGLKIYTTLDSSSQIVLNESIQKNMTLENLQCSSILIEPYTFQIKAIAGGKNYESSQFNRALHASRQVASTIKPLLYYSAIKSGFDPTTTFLSEPTVFKLANGQDYSPTNFGGLYAKKNITLASAIGVSDNVYAMKTHLFLGEQTLANQLKEFGYEHVTPDASLALGTFSGSVYDIAKIYASFASRGLYSEPYCISKIEDQEGNILYKYDQKPIQLLDETTCLILTQLLTSTFDENCVSYTSPTMLRYQREQPFAAKSGTSDFDSIVAGYNQSIVCASWVGFDNNLPLNNYQDRKIAKDIWFDVTNQYLNSLWYTPNDQIEEKIINPVTGELSVTGSKYWFLKK